MSEALGREIFIIEFWHFLALVVILGVNTWFYKNGEKGPILKRFMLLQGILFLWIVSKMLKTIAPDVSLRWFFIVTQYLGVNFLGAFFLLFALAVVFPTRPSRFLEGLLIFISSVFFLIVVSNPWHFLFYDTYTFYRDTFGPLFYVFSLYTYGLVLLAIGIFAYGLVMNRKKNNSLDVFVVVAGILPFIMNSIYTYRLFGLRPYFDYTPLFMVLSLAFFGISAYRSRFLGILPKAWKQILLDSEDPVILIDQYGSILTSNRLNPQTQPDRVIYQNERIFNLYRKLENKKVKVFLYADVTEIESLKNEIQSKNIEIEGLIYKIHQRNEASLAAMKRELFNRSCRELHDVLGHSLTQVIYILRLLEKGHSSFFGIDDPIQDCSNIIQNGLIRLNRGQDDALNDSLNEGNCLSIALGSLIQGSFLPGVRIDFFIRGEERSLSGDLVQELVSCCREGITNAIKHGNPTKIEVALIFGKVQVVVLLVDNGRGCVECKGGNGLGLMCLGLERFGGNLGYTGSENMGFQLTIRVPYSRTNGDLSGNTILSPGKIGVL